MPDVFLPVPQGRYHGLYIELKAGRNTTTENQRKWLDYLQKQGYYTAVCYGWQTAAELIEMYLLRYEQLGKSGQTLGKGKELDVLKIGHPDRATRKTAQGSRRKHG